MSGVWTVVNETLHYIEKASANVLFYLAISALLYNRYSRNQLSRLPSVSHLGKYISNSGLQAGQKHMQ